MWKTLYIFMTAAPSEVSMPRYFMVPRSRSRDIFLFAPTQRPSISP